MKVLNQLQKFTLQKNHNNNIYPVLELFLCCEKHYFFRPELREIYFLKGTFYELMKFFDLKFSCISHSCLDLQKSNYFQPGYQLHVY